jgi:homopolymeric O-antigen transport system permease protein
MNQLIADCREMLTEQVQYRELLYEMTRRDLLIRYKQTIMGFGWAVFMPLVNTAVFSVIFTRVAPIETQVPYPLFAYCGLLAWNFSASTLRASVGSLTGNAGLVTKVYFPREIFPFSAMLVSLVDLLVGSTVLVALMLWFHVLPSHYIVILPLVIAVHVVFTAAVSLFVAMANLFYRDVKYIFEVVITLWMFATSVLYPVRTMHGRLGTLLRLNPMTAIIDGYRDVLFGAGPPDWASLSAAALLSVVVLLVVWTQFHRSEFEFAERI